VSVRGLVPAVRHSGVWPKKIFRRRFEHCCSALALRTYSVKAMTFEVIFIEVVQISGFRDLLHELRCLLPFVLCDAPETLHLSQLSDLPVSKS
jgi:hypothetical protein